MTKTILLEGGYFYHIYNRGNNGEAIFKESHDYSYFLHLLAKHILPIAHIYCYCLLNNHFHLLIKIKEEDGQKTIEGQSLNASQIFSNFFNAYAKSFNRKYYRTGKLFEERFKRKRVDYDSYFTELIYYIHANPQRHRIIDDFRNYPHSSYQQLIINEPTILSKDEIMEWFAGKSFFEQYHAERVVYLLNYQAFEK